MKPLTTEELRAAAHRKVDAADDALLISILEMEQTQIARLSGHKYSEADLADLHQASEDYNRGELPTYSGQEFWERIKQQTGYQRQYNNEA